MSGCSSTGERLAGINAITTSAYCPSSKQPELKHAAVKVLKAELPWSLLGVAWLPEAHALAAREQLTEKMALFPFASCVPFSNNTPLSDTPASQRTGILFRAASYEAPLDGVQVQIETLLGLNTHDTLRYADKKKGRHRAVRLARVGDQAHLAAFLLAGDTSAQAWITTLLRQELPAQAYGRLLLAPGAKPPLAVLDAARGQQVCSRFNVSDAAINTHLAASTGTIEQRLASLQTALKCGTNCGSRVPQLKRMVRETAAATVAAG